MQRVEVVEMRLARSDHSTPAIVGIGLRECTFYIFRSRIGLQYTNPVSGNAGRLESFMWSPCFFQSLQVNLPANTCAVVPQLPF